MLKKLFGRQSVGITITPVVQSFSDREIQPSDEAMAIVHDALKWADDLYGPYERPHRIIYTAIDPDRPDDVFWTRFSSYVDGHFCGWGSWWAIWFPCYVEVILQHDTKEAAIVFARFCLTNKGQVWVNDLTQYRIKFWDKEMGCYRHETDNDKMFEGLV